jgi:thiol-disulfide isomerase/thioredoxin
MDRLSTVAALGLLTFGCGGDDGAKAPAPSRSRVDAVEAKAEAPVELEEFCDVYPSPSAAPQWSWPPLTARRPVPEPGRKRWINVWAAWCKPCVEELPRLISWRDSINERVPFELVFLSGDSEPDELERFVKHRPAVADTLQIADALQLTSWLAEIGIGYSGVLPVHIFVDAKDRIRCVRTSGMRDEDRKAVEQLLMSL